MAPAETARVRKKPVRSAFSCCVQGKQGPRKQPPRPHFEKKLFWDPFFNPVPHHLQKNMDFHSTAKEISIFHSWEVKGGDFLTLRHDAVHGNREEEDGVAVVSPRAGAEVLLHGLHDWEELLSKSGHVVERDLRVKSTPTSVKQRRMRCNVIILTLS